MVVEKPTPQKRPRTTRHLKDLERNVVGFTFATRKFTEKLVATFMLSIAFRSPYIAQQQKNHGKVKH